MEVFALVAIAGGVFLFWVLRKAPRNTSLHLKDAQAPLPPSQESPKQNSSGPAPTKSLGSFHVAPQTTNQAVTLNTLSSPKLDSSLLGQLPSARTTKAPGRWLAAEEVCEIQGIRVPGGLIYVGDSLSRIKGYGAEPGLIVPSLPIKEGGNGSDMPYWPSYSELSPESRRAYLLWLSTGRKNPQANIGFVFLYFYGLERRAIAEIEKVSDEEFRLIRSEVQRLLTIYGENASFRRYGTVFLGLLEVTRVKADRLIENPPMITKAYESPNLPLRVGLGWMVSTGKSIPAIWALAWVKSHETFNERTPVLRCPAEFESLFCFRYQQQFGDGVVVKPNKTPLRASYVPASASFGGELSIDINSIPDVKALKQPIEKLLHLADECIDELDPYSRYLGRNPDSTDTPAALSLLPTPLIEGRDHLVLQRIADWLEEQSFADGFASIHYRDLHALWPSLPEGEIPKRDAVMIAHCFQRLGFGLEPDVRFGSHRLQVDDKIILFRLPSDAPVAPSMTYTSCTLLAHLGAVIAHADNQVTIEEEQALMAHAARNTDLNEPERLRLKAYTKWLLLAPPELSGLKKRIECLGPTDRSSLAAFLAHLVGTDGHIAPSEITALQKIYRQLGLDPESVFQDTHAAATDPVSVLPAQAAPTYQIPVPSSITKTPSGIDLIRVRAMEAESEKVSVLLRGIFVDETDATANIASSSMTADAPTIRLLDLDAAHSQFALALLARDQWSRAELEAIASARRLMPEGAIDCLNEAALNIHGEPLLEGDDPIEINLQLRSVILT